MIRNSIRDEDEDRGRGTRDDVPAGKAGDKQEELFPNFQIISFSNYLIFKLIPSILTEALNILYEDNHIIAVNKTHHDLVQKDTTGDTSLDDQN